MAQLDPQTLQKLSQQAAAMGLTLDAFLRMSQGPAAAIQSPAQMPQQRPFAEGAGPGGQYGGGQGQTEQPWQAWTPQAMGGSQPNAQQPGIGAQISPAGYSGPEEGVDPNAPQQQPSVWEGIKSKIMAYNSLGNVGAILTAAADPQGRSLAPTLTKVNEQFAQAKNLEDQKAAYYAEQEKQAAMAHRLADNLRDTNPEAAALLDENPGLVQDYMRGRLKTQGDLEVEKFKVVNDPKTKLLNAEMKRWDEFLERNKLGDSSTLEIYSKYYHDPAMNENEAATLASAHMQGGQEKLDSTYQQILDNRNNKEATGLSKQVAALTGLNLNPDEWVVNAQEVIDSYDTDNPVEPIVKAVKGSKLWKEQQETNQKLAAGDAIAWRNADIVVSASGRAKDILQKQIDAEAAGELTGFFGPAGGIAQFIKDLPYQVSGDAGKLSNEFKVINSRMTTDTLIEGRKATEAGGSIYGNASDFDAITARSGFEILDQLRSPQELVEKLERLDKLYINFMTPSPADSKKSTLQVHAEKIVNAPPERRAEYIAAFNALYGDGMADIVLRKAGLQ